MDPKEVFLVQECQNGEWTVDSVYSTYELAEKQAWVLYDNSSENVMVRVSSAYLNTNNAPFVLLAIVNGTPCYSTKTI